MFAVKHNQWIGYDNQRSIAEKVKFLNTNNLGGAIIWSIDLDDFKGDCGNGKFPLLNSIVNEMKKGEQLKKEQEMKKEQEKKKCEPGGLDTIYGVSQVKSLLQWIFGDSEGAKCTQENFSKGAPIVSQIRSAVEAGRGDHQAARETQMFFLKNMESQIDGIPLIGHVKGGVHLLLGDTERGEEIIKGASRNTAVIIGAVAGGPAGALAAGVGYDAVVTGLDSLAKGEWTPYGVVGDMENFDEYSTGQKIDATASIAFDLLSGKAAKRCMFILFS